MNNRYRPIIVFGAVGAGKSSLLRKIAELLIMQEVKVKAIISKGQFEGERRSSFELEFIPKHQFVKLCQRDKLPDWIEWNQWWFNPEAFLLGERFLKTADNNSSLVILDEIGRMEIEGKGWAKTLDMLLSQQTALIISARDIFVSEIIEHWPYDWITADVHRAGPEQVVKMLRKVKS